MSEVREASFYTGTLHFVTAGYVPTDGVAIKGDDVFVYGRLAGTLMRISIMPGGATVHYLASSRRG